MGLSHILLAFMVKTQTQAKNTFNLSIFCITCKVYTGKETEKFKKKQKVSFYTHKAKKKMQFLNFRWYK